MLNEAMLKDFYELTQIEVYSKKERAICDVLKAKLEKLGLTVDEDDTGSKIGGTAGNIYAILPGEEDIEPILFSAHMDRVGNNGKVTPIYNEEEGIIYSDGKTILAADDVSGICVVLEVLRQIKEQNLRHGTIEVAFSVCEEVGVTGSSYYDFSRFKSKMAFVFDIPGRIGRVVTQAPGKGKITIGVHGRAAHAGNEPEKGLNALKITADLLMHLPDGRVTPETTTNFSIISAGTATNVVCEFVQLVGEERSTNEAEYMENTKNIERITAEIAAKYNTKIDLDILTQYRTFNVDKNAAPCRIAKMALASIGEEARFERGGGGMDGNHFNAHGITTIGIAPGYSKNHTPNEQLIVADMLKCGKAALEIVKIVANGKY